MLQDVRGGVLAVSRSLSYIGLASPCTRLAQELLALVVLDGRRADVSIAGWAYGANSSRLAIQVSNSVQRGLSRLGVVDLSFFKSVTLLSGHAARSVSSRSSGHTAVVLKRLTWELDHHNRCSRRYALDGRWVEQSVQPTRLRRQSVDMLTTGAAARGEPARCRVLLLCPSPCGRSSEADAAGAASALSYRCRCR